MGTIILYHGTPEKMVAPTYGLGEDKHDYRRGFYLTESIELAKEWAVYRPNDENGWVHKYELECAELKLLDFQKLNVLTWLAELMKHRETADSKRYRMLFRNQVWNKHLWIIYKNLCLNWDKDFALKQDRKE